MNIVVGPLHMEYVQSLIRHRQLNPRTSMLVALGDRYTRFGHVARHFNITQRGVPRLIRVDQVF